MKVAGNEKQSAISCMLPYARVHTCVVLALGHGTWGLHSFQGIFPLSLLMPTLQRNVEQHMGFGCTWARTGVISLIMPRYLGSRLQLARTTW